jgi:hypothetical protein
MNEPMSLRTLHTPGWMDEELRMLAFKLKLNKAELMRRMIEIGLDSCWEHLIKNPNEPNSVIHYTPSGKTQVSAKALAAMQTAA